jgi:hypothetical protein
MFPKTGLLFTVGFLLQIIKNWFCHHVFPWTLPFYVD